MARMKIESVRMAVAEDGIVTLPDAEDTVVGQVARDGKKWTAKVAAADGKVGRAKSEHATRQAAFLALLQAQGVVKPTEEA